MHCLILTVGPHGGSTGLYTAALALSMSHTSTAETLALSIPVHWARGKDGDASQTERPLTPQQPRILAGVCPLWSPACNHGKQVRWASPRKDLMMLGPEKRSLEGKGQLVQAARGEEGGESLTRPSASTLWLPWATAVP